MSRVACRVLSVGNGEQRAALRVNFAMSGVVLAIGPLDGVGCIQLRGVSDIVA